MKPKITKNGEDTELGSSGSRVHRLTNVSTIAGGLVVGLFLCLQLIRNPLSSILAPFEPFESGNPSVVPQSTEASKAILQTQWMTDISGANETSCQTAFEKSRNKQWEDPNHDMFLYRRIKTEPHFLVSVHNQQYDPVRYTAIYHNGNYYEGSVIQHFEFILGENRDSFDYNSTPAMPVVIDIGGNIGYYSLLSAAWKHAVVTFEINPANIIRICESLHLNSRNEHGFSELSHSMAVMIHRQGVSNITGSTFRVEVHKNPGQTALENGPKGKDTGKTTQRFFSTTTVTLDDFAEERGWFHRTDFTVSILKIDTEGHELQIIEGAQRFIQTRVVKNILLEYRAHCREIMNTLLDSGYVIVSGYVVVASNPLRLLNKAESIKTLDEVTKKLLLGKTPGDYEDLWFRLDNLPVINTM